MFQADSARSAHVLTAPISVLRLSRSACSLSQFRLSFRFDRAENDGRGAQGSYVRTVGRNAAPVLGVRPAPDAVGAERGLQPGDVRGRAQRGVDLHGAGERGPRLAAVVGVDEVPGRRLQRLRPLQRPAGLVVALRGREQPGGVVVQQAAAVQRVRLPVRDLRSGGEGVGLAGEGLRGAQVAGLRWRGGRRRPAGPRSPRVLRYCRRTRRSARPAPRTGRRPARGPGCGPAPAGR